MRSRDGIRALIRDLAAQPPGFRPLDFRLKDGQDGYSALGYTHAEIGVLCRQMVLGGQLFAARISHKEARYFTTLKARDAFVGVDARAVGVQYTPSPIKAEWDADAEPIITENTKFTRCPDMPQHPFQERVMPFVHGGLRCA